MRSSTSSGGRNFSFSFFASLAVSSFASSASPFSSLSISRSENSRNVSRRPSSADNCPAVSPSSALFAAVPAALSCLPLFRIGTSKSLRNRSRTSAGDAAPQFSQTFGIEARNSRTSALYTSRMCVWMDSHLGRRGCEARTASYFAMSA